jgi:hypothetical protein
MASLYEDGWRQGSILTARLPFETVVLDDHGRPRRSGGDHERWAIASQECELDLTETDSAEPVIELRPVYSDEPPPDWGLRSARLRLTETEYVVSSSPRAFVSAGVLSALLSAGAERREIAPARRQAFKTWLGLRYDRPALPPELVPLARRIAEEVRHRRNRPTGARVRDVLMQFDESHDPVRFSLYAILAEPSEEGEVREWLATIANAVPAELGIADVIEAAPATRISVYLLETSYAADVTALTWRPNRPDPEGAT